MKTTQTQHQLLLSFFFGCLFFASTPAFAPKVDRDVKEYFKGFHINLSEKDIYSADEIADINAMHEHTKQFALTSGIETERQKTSPIVGLRGDSTSHSPEKLIHDMRARMGKFFSGVLGLRTQVDISQIQPPRLPPRPSPQLALHNAPTSTSLSRQLINPQGVLLNKESLVFLQRQLSRRSASVRKSVTARTESDTSSETAQPSPTTRSTKSHRSPAAGAAAANLAVAIATAHDHAEDASPNRLKPSRATPHDPAAFRALNRSARSYGISGKDLSAAKMRTLGSTRRSTRSSSRRTPRASTRQVFLLQDDPSTLAASATRSMKRLASTVNDAHEVVAVVHGLAPPPPQQRRRRLGSEIAKTHNKVRGITPGSEIAKIHHAVRGTR